MVDWTRVLWRPIDLEYAPSSRKKRLSCAQDGCLGRGSHSRGSAWGGRGEQLVVDRDEDRSSLPMQAGWAEGEVSRA